MPRFELGPVKPVSITDLAGYAAGAGDDGEAYSQSVVVRAEHHQLANVLAEKHGTVQLAVESSGVHAYMASPKCLEEDGSVELTKRHLAVNLDKYLAGIDLSGQCMKTGKAYRVSKLLKMAPLADRGFKKSTSKVVQHAADPDQLEDDGKGNMIPRGPGEVIPILKVPQDNPGLIYLAERGFTNLIKAWAMCRMSWCTKENPKSFWKPAKGGFKETSQNRLILFIDQFGVQRGWQGRILDAQRGKAWYHLHPYTNQWVKTHTRASKASEWVEALEPLDIKWKPRKYIFPAGIQRNQCLMGLDAAIAWNHGRDRKLAILVEGPLDMLRFGPPAMATMGKYYSSEQRDLVVQNFNVVVYVADRDAGGDIGRQKVYQQLKDAPVSLHFEDIPGDWKDAGEMPQAAADAFLHERILRWAK